MVQSWRRPLVVFLALLAAGTCYGEAPAAPAVPAAAPTLEVRGLSLMAREAQPGKRTIGMYGTPGTTVDLLVSRPAGGLIAYANKATVVSKMADDKGTNLLTPATEGYSRSVNVSSRQVAPDGKEAAVTVFSPGLPAKGATALTIQGVLAFRAAAQQKSVEQASVPVRIGSTITAGPLVLEVTRIGKTEAWGGQNQKMKESITLESQQDLADIVAIKFSDAAGNAIESSDAGTMSGMSGDGERTITARTYNLAQMVDTISVTITYWADVQTITIPLDLKAG